MAAPTSDTAVTTTLAALVPAGMLVVGQTYVAIPLFDTLARTWGTSVASITVLPTLFAIGYGTGQTIWGVASDSFGRRAVLVVGVVLTGLLTAAVGLTNSLGQAVGVVIAQGLAASSFTPGALAYIGERVEPARRPLATSVLTTSFFASAALTQVIAQLVLDAGGWRTVFVAFGGAMLIAAAALFAVIDPTRRSAHRRPDLAVLGPLVRNRRLMVPIVASIAMFAAFVGIYAGLELMGPGGLDHDPDALLWLRASGLPALLCVPFIVRRTARFDPSLRAVVGMTLAAAALVALVPAGGSVVAVALVMLVFVASIAQISPAIAQIVVRESGPATGAAMGLWGLFLFAGASVGPQLAALFQPVGFAALVAALAGGLLIAAAVIERERRRALDMTHN